MPVGQLPFDPGRMAARSGASPDRVGEEAPLTVSQLARSIGDALQAGFPKPVRVIGEVSGFKPGTHWYFSLKDADAVVSCVMFAGTARASSFTPANGQEVVVTARPDFWGKGGRTSLIVSRIDPVGEGALDAAFRRMCEEIRALGWFDDARKRSIPAFPRRVAVVTSKTGAALHDVLDTMRRRCPVVPVALVDVQVQGDGAADQVARALRWLGRQRKVLGVDVILLTRGGGSKEDLWTFNERLVAEAIVNCPVPVVAAIGHETDVSIAELVADLRCATPTQAAMRITPDLPAMLEQLGALEGALRRGTERRVREDGRRILAAARHLSAAALAGFRGAAHRLERAGARLDRQRPVRMLAHRLGMLEAMSVRLRTVIRQRLSALDLDGVRGRLARACGLAMERRRVRLDALERQLTAVGPLSVLNRGFSYTLRDDGRLVRSTEDVRLGDRIQTRVSDGTFGSTVEGMPPVRVTRPRRGPTAPGPPDQMDLFGGGR